MIRESEREAKAVEKAAYHQMKAVDRAAQVSIYRWQSLLRDKPMRLNAITVNLKLDGKKLALYIIGVHEVNNRLGDDF